MRFFTNIVCPVLGLILLAAELGLIGLGLFRPHVSPNYYNYFISQQQSCWLPDDAVKQAETELAAPAYNIANLSAGARCYLLETGWSDVESSGVWTDARIAHVQLPPSPAPRVLQLTLNAFAPGKENQAVAVLDNRRVLKTIHVPQHEINLFQLDVPPSAKPVVLSFDVADPAEPAALGQGNDTRLLGIQLIGLAWLPPKP